MPDIIRPATAGSTVVVTISSVADQSTLNAVSPTVSATVDGSSATITAWAWKVNGATTGITGPTTATPSYTPTTAGAKVITVDVTILGVVYSSLPEIFVVGPTALSVSIAAVSDQLDLSAATLDSTVTGGVTPYTYAWTVNGATTGLSSSTAADPTYTPTAAGTPTAVVTVTDGAGQVAKASVTWRIGDTEGFVYWMVDFSDPTYDGHDFVSTGNLTVNGLTIVKSGAGAGSCPAGNLVVTDGKLKVQTTAAHGLLGIGFDSGTLATSLFDGAEPVDYAIGAAFDTTLSADADGVLLYWSGTIVIAERHSGVQKVLSENATPASTRYTIPGGVQPKAVESRIIGRYVMRAQYTHTALTISTIPLPSVMSKVPLPPSGNMTRAVVPPGTGADTSNPMQDGGWYCVATNSLRYDIKFIWIRWKPGPM